MLKKLKRKFVIINMCLVGTVLLAAFAVVCANAYQQAYLEVKGALIMAIKNTREDKPAQFMIGTPQEGHEAGSGEGDYREGMMVFRNGFEGKPFSYAAVVILVNEENGERQIKTLNMSNASMDDDVINDAAAVAMSSDEAQGRIRDMALFYMKVETFSGTKIAFADSTYFGTEVRKTVAVAAALFLIAMGALLLISLFLASVAVAPAKKAWEKQRRFVADASHELKTPLTVLLANNEIMLSVLDDMESGSFGVEPESDAGKVFEISKGDGAGSDLGKRGVATADGSDDSRQATCGFDVCGRRLTDDIIDMRRWLESSREEAVQMKGLVDDLLFLARADEAEETASDINIAVDKKATMVDVDISDIVMGAALQMEPVAFEAGVDMTADVEAKIHMKCDVAQIKQLVHILLDNAVKYCRKTSFNGACDSESNNCSDGGKVLLDLHKTADNIVLTVANTGEVIDSEDIEHIFDRFYRSDKARSGNGYGLGLSIAKTIAESHGGTIRAYSGVLDSEVCEKLKRAETQDETSTENPTGTVMTVVF